MSRILLVDDAIPTRTAMAKLLKQEGHEISVARNGAEGLVQLKQSIPDLIMLDQMMPEVDGLTFLSSIRRFPKWKHIRVVMMTGLSDQQSHNRANLLGVDAYIVKGSQNAAALVSQVRKYLPDPTAAAIVPAAADAPARATAVSPA